MRLIIWCETNLTLGIQRPWPLFHARFGKTITFVGALFFWMHTLIFCFSRDVAVFLYFLLLSISVSFYTHYDYSMNDVFPSSFLISSSNYFYFCCSSGFSCDLFSKWFSASGFDRGPFLFHKGSFFENAKLLDGRINYRRKEWYCHVIVVWCGKNYCLFFCPKLKMFSLHDQNKHECATQHKHRTNSSFQGWK